MTNLGKFLKYAIDFRKVKTLILLIQTVTLIMLVSCRSQFEKDFKRFQAEIEALQASHNAEIEQLTIKRKGDKENECKKRT